MRDAAISLPERHLGLVQASEASDLSAYLDRLAALAEQNLDLDAILACGAPFHAQASHARALPPPGQRIAVAEDAAFGFFYPHLAQDWRAAGAELVKFSPLADEPPPEDCDSCWLPGGYPELHAAALAGGQKFRTGLRNFSASRAVHGECGGFMVLGEGLIDANGTRHEMTGLLGHTTSFARPKLHLGYREARLLADGPLGCAGAVLRGHEFHYATPTDPGSDPPFAALRDAAGRDLGDAGGRRGLVSGSFFHVIAASEDPA